MQNGCIWVDWLNTMYETYLNGICVEPPITDDEQLDQAIEQTKRDILSGKKMDMTSATGRGGWFDTIFYCVMFVLLFYFAERDYGFNVLHWLAKVFPKEAAVIRQAQQW